jgi:hypothetical protein
MRFITYPILGAAISILSASAYAQTGYKNTTNDWIMVSNVSGSHGELIGKIFAAPKTTLWIENGRISHGAGKFVAEPGAKELLACSVPLDEQIDFVSVEVSRLSWNAFGYPLEIALHRPIVSYHLTADKSDNIEEERLLADGTYPGFNIEKKSDAVILDEVSGKVDHTPDVFVNFVIKSGDKAIRERIGLFIGFNWCKVAESVPSAPALLPKTPSASAPVPKLGSGSVGPVPHRLTLLAAVGGLAADLMAQHRLTLLAAVGGLAAVIFAFWRMRRKRNGKLKD